MQKYKNFENNIITKAYLAGFIDGNGSLYARIIPVAKSELKFKVSINISFYQLKKHVYFIKAIQKYYFNKGHLRTRGIMCDLTISDIDSVEMIIKDLIPYLHIKKPQAKYMLEIIKNVRYIRSKNSSFMEKKATFLEVCILIDKVANLNNSKNRVWTYQKVLDEYNK